MKRYNYVLVAILMACFIIAYILGFRIVYDPELENSWEAISAIGSWAGVIATIAIAISLRIRGNSIAPSAKLIKYSVIEDNPYLTVTNTGEKPLIISQISFNAGKYSVGRINAEDDFDIGSVITDHYVIRPFEVGKINLPLVLFQSQLAEYHHGDPKEWQCFEKKIKNKHIKISVKDITGKYHTLKTSISAVDFVKIIGNG